MKNKQNKTENIDELQKSKDEVDLDVEDEPKPEEASDALINDNDSKDEIVESDCEEDPLIEVIDKLDIDDTKKEDLKMVMRRENYSGPIPHPDLLKKYDEIGPHIVDKIFDLTQSELDSIVDLRKNHSLREDERLRLAGRDNKMGAWFAFIIIVLTVSFGFYLIILDKDVLGLVFGGTGLVSAIKLFIFPERFLTNDNNRNLQDEEDNSGNENDSNSEKRV